MIQRYLKFLRRTIVILLGQGIFSPSDYQYLRLRGRLLEPSGQQDCIGYRHSLHVVEPVSFLLLVLTLGHIVPTVLQRLYVATQQIIPGLHLQTVHLAPHRHVVRLVESRLVRNVEIIPIFQGNIRCLPGKYGRHIDR